MHTAICAFDDRARAEQAVDDLVRAGFARHDVHIEHKHRDNPSGHVDTDAQHVERGGFVVVVDADNEADAERARAMLHELQAGDLNVVHRRDQRPLRDIVRQRDEPAGMVERSRASYESWSNDAATERERAMASHRLDPTKGPELRDPDLGHPPGLRYADKGKPD